MNNEKLAKDAILSELAFITKLSESLSKTHQEMQSLDTTLKAKLDSLTIDDEDYVLFTEKDVILGLHGDDIRTRSARLLGMYDMLKVSNLEISFEEETQLNLDSLRNSFPLLLAEDKGEIIIKDPKILEVVNAGKNKFAQSSFDLFKQRAGVASSN